MITVNEKWLTPLEDFQSPINSSFITMMYNLQKVLREKVSLNTVKYVSN